MKARIVLFDHWFDLRYGVDTCRRASLDSLQIKGGNRSHGNRYEPSRILPVMRFLREVDALLPEPRVLVDMGSGKGRVLLVASKFRFVRAKGIEFAQELCEVAERNCAKFRRGKGEATEFRVIQTDAAVYPIIPEDNVFFFFNPFDDVVLSQVLQNIEQSMREYPRRILICCYNLPSTELLDRQPNFSRQAEYDFWGYKFVVYQSRVEQNQSHARLSASAKQQQAVDMIHPR